MSKQGIIKNKRSIYHPSSAAPAPLPPNILDAEAEARERGCRGAQVDTLSFQGLEFYQRLGFRVAGRVDDFPPGHARYFLVKDYA